MIQHESIGPDLQEQLSLLEAERQRLQVALQESQARLEAFLDHSPVVAFIKDEDGRHLYCNQPFYQVFQWQPDQVIGRPAADLFPSDVERQLREHDAQVLTSNQPLQTVEHVPTPDGVLRSWLVIKFPILDKVGRRFIGGVAVDITERQRTEEALKDREAWLRNLITNVPGAVYRCGYAPDWTIHYISDAIETISGYAASDFVHNHVRSYISIVHPADWHVIEKQAMEAIARRQHYDVEYRILHRLGGVRWVQERGQAVWGPTGDILYLDGFILDITERKRADEALRQQAQILGQTHDAVIITDLDGFIREWNPGAIRLYGYQPDEIIGKHVTALYREQDATAMPPKILEALRSKGSLETECWKRRKSGEHVFVHMSLSLLRGPGGIPVGMVGYTVDITQRHRMEEKLRESEEFHRQIADLSYDYAYSCSVEADGAIRLESVTEGFTRVTGYTLEELKAKGDWVALIHPEDLVKSIENDPLAEDHRIQELRILTKAGAVRWIRFSTHPLREPETGRAYRLIGAVHDITEQKQAEQQLRDYAEKHQSLSRRLLEVQEEERRHLARELHDEIGQELTGLQYAMEMGELARPDELRSCMANARGMVKDLMVRVRELSMGLRPTLLDDMGLFPALRWLFQRYTSQTGVQVHYELEGRDRRFLPAVETTAYRIIQEALTNVARHASVREAQVRIRLDDERLEIHIADQGAGFVPQTAARRGTSGLSGMHERAGLLHGQVQIDTAPGKGTRLTVHLPIPEQPNGHETLSRG